MILLDSPFWCRMGRQAALVLLSVLDCLSSSDIEKLI